MIMKKSFFNKVALTTTICSLLFFSCKKELPMNAPSTSAPENTESFGQKHQLSRQVEEIASNLSSFLARKENRKLLLSQMKTAGKTSTIELGDVLSTVRGQARQMGTDQLSKLMENISQAEVAMKDAKMAIPRLDLVVPCGISQAMLEGSDLMYVAIAPLEDESKVKSIAAYVDGKRLSQDLSANEAPKVPTIVIGGAERYTISSELTAAKTESVVASALAVTAADVPKSAAVSGDLVGIPRILITNDHEPWYKGDPEIYVKIRRWIKSMGVFGDTRVDFANVNSENTWYSLGDPNKSYVFLNSTYDKSIEIVVYESDSPDGDDVVGLFIPTWTSLPYGGFTAGTPLGTTRDAQIYLDRD